MKKNVCFGKKQIKFLGQIIDENGIASDSNKVRAIRDMAAPTNITEIRRFLGMVNQLSKFFPHLADETKLLRELLSSKNQWAWGSAQQESFDKIKAKQSSTQVLAMYNAAY